jgi:hypothetical protein
MENFIKLKVSHLRLDDLWAITYQWYDVSDPAASFTVGAPTAVPTLTVTGKAAGTYAYVCEVANAACTLATSSYTVQVLAAPTISITGGNASQTVTVGIAMTAIIYVRNLCTGCTLSTACGFMFKNPDMSLQIQFPAAIQTYSDIGMRLPTYEEACCLHDNYTQARFGIPDVFELVHALICSTRIRPFLLATILERWQHLR